jgi:transposase
MSVAYSKDFRKKVLDCVLEGKSCHASAIKFNIAHNTVLSWYKRYLELGHCCPKKNLGKKPRIDVADFEKYVQENPDKTLKQIGENFEMTDVGALYYMNKINFRYKKKSHVIERLQKNRCKNI